MPGVRGKRVAWGDGGGAGCAHGDRAARRRREFAALVRPLLDADPLRHTITLTVLDELCRGGEAAATLATVHDGGAVVGALLRPRPARAGVCGATHAVARSPVAGMSRLGPVYIGPGYRRHGYGRR